MYTTLLELHVVRRTICGYMYTVHVVLLEPLVAAVLSVFFLAGPSTQGQKES